MEAIYTIMGGTLPLAFIVGIWAYLSKSKAGVVLGNLIFYCFYTVPLGYYMVYEPPGSGGMSFAAFMVWMLVLGIHTFIAFVALIVARVQLNKESQRRNQ